MSKMKTEDRNAISRTEDPNTKLVGRKSVLNREMPRVLSAQTLEKVAGGYATRVMHHSILIGL